MYVGVPLIQSRDGIILVLTVCKLNACYTSHKPIRTKICSLMVGLRVTPSKMGVVNFT